MWSENVGHTLTLLEQDVLQMLVNSNDAMKGPKYCVDQITAWSCWGVEPHFRTKWHVAPCIALYFASIYNQFLDVSALHLAKVSVWLLF